MLKSLLHKVVEHKWIVLVLVLGAFFRFWGTFEIPTYIEDEAIQIPNAMSLGEYGTNAKMNGVHPPLSGYILYGTIRLLGNNPYGWRISNALLGTFSAGLLYLTAGLLSPGSAVPIIAASLLAFDPFHFAGSRTTHMEIPAAFFFLLYLYLMLAYSERRRPTLPLAGIAMGLTIATKAYYVLAIPLVALYAFYRAHERGEKTALLCFDFAVALCFLPLAVYLLSYMHWFGRGYTFGEFLQMKRDMYRILQSFTLETSNNPWYVKASGKPWEWFLKPVIHGFELFSDGRYGRFLLQIDNFPFRMLLVPSLISLFVVAWKQRSTREIFVSLLFISCYMLVFLVKRPIFGHSALAVLPLAYLVVARAVVLFARWCGREKAVYAGFISAVVLWGIYTFPLASARLVPLALYRPILSIATIWGL